MTPATFAIWHAVDRFHQPMSRFRAAYVTSYMWHNFSETREDVAYVT